MFSIKNGFVNIFITVYKSYSAICDDHIGYKNNINSRIRNYDINVFRIYHVTILHILTAVGLHVVNRPIDTLDMGYYY